MLLLWWPSLRPRRGCERAGEKEDAWTVWRDVRWQLVYGFLVLSCRFMVAASNLHLRLLYTNYVIECDEAFDSM